MWNIHKEPCLYITIQDPYIKICINLFESINSTIFTSYFSGEIFKSGFFNNNFCLSSAPRRMNFPLSFHISYFVFCFLTIIDLGHHVPLLGFLWILQLTCWVSSLLTCHSLLHTAAMIIFLKHYFYHPSLLESLAWSISSKFLILAFKTFHQQSTIPIIFWPNMSLLLNTIVLVSSK